jgi:hypothetical protein
MNSVVMELVYQRTRCVSRFLVAKQTSSRASLAPTDLRCPESLRISQGMVEPKFPTPQMQQNPHLAGFVLLRIWWATECRFLHAGT